MLPIHASVIARYAWSQGSGTESEARSPMCEVGWFLAQILIFIAAYLRRAPPLQKLDGLGIDGSEKESKPVVLHRHNGSKQGMRGSWCSIAMAQERSTT